MSTSRGAGAIRIVADTSPLVAAADRRDPLHELAAEIVAPAARSLVVLDSVVIETDQLLRSRVGHHAARSFLDAIRTGAHKPAFLSQGILERAAQIDAQYAALGLGFADAALMAYAERHDLPILTFDFRHFRATEGERGPWRLVLGEEDVARTLG